MLRTKVLASSSGFAIGAFLFFLVSQLQADPTWGLRWYEAALFLGGIGLAGVFPAAWLLASLSMAVGAFLVVVVQMSMEMSRDPTCCNLGPIAWVSWFIWDFPAPLFGAAFGRLVSRTRIPQPLYLALLASALMIGVSWPWIEKAGKKRDRDQLVADMNRVIEFDPKAASAYYHRGNAYASNGDLDRAITDMNKMIELNPEFPYYYELRGNAYAKKGDLDRAIADLNKAIELLPNNFRGLDARGHILEALGRKDEAIADFRRALANARGRKDPAMPDFQRALVVKEPDPQEIADALRRLGASP